MLQLTQCEVISNIPVRVNYDLENMKTIIGKVVILGHQGVGKTSTCTRYVEKTFNRHISPTIGASFFISRIKVLDDYVKLQIWDTAGQERFKAMTPMFYRNAKAAFLMFDITSEASFNSMKNWVLELRRNVEQPMVLCVLGNKIDLAERRVVSRDEALAYSKTIGARYFEISAMRDQGIEIVFKFVAMELLRMSTKNSSATSLKVYNTENVNGVMASSSELEATDIGNEEIVNMSINSIAHGHTVPSRCC
ncbi:hypothetical protein WA026_005002 [Henosepilachna vigintioctopunctata]|uniref:Uncharacterized protein n=1 Tax=Henosepilachna vigintioctopunctata TaxID=420089 RepID=A0AAW1UNG6_9CUCU